MTEKLCVGIDLGTTNCSIAIQREHDAPAEVIPVLQACSPGKISSNKLLPSTCYIPLESEQDGALFQLPWIDNPAVVIGEYAKERAFSAPDRTVVSAKSWLCNSQTDRHEEFLPWKSEVARGKLSPVSASSELLKHLWQSFLYWQRTEFASLLKQSEVIITVPASFDEVARSLTHEAAENAGIHGAVLLEEPLAAFYSWIASSSGHWRNQIQKGDIVLVCDVGGGTADFTLIAVSEKDGDLNLDRISVGEHILLGGDNMDLALAISLKSKLEKAGRKLDRWQFLSLIHCARKAKEELFADERKQEYPIALAGRGANLFASALTTVLNRQDLHSIILDGFIPTVSANEAPFEKRNSGLQELGLPYAADPALSKHLAHFLTRSLSTVRADRTLKSLVRDFEEHEQYGFIKPTKVLFNGGVFKALPIRSRFKELLSSWCQKEVVELPGAELDLAVSKGAATYGMFRASGKGLRIRSKTLRSYYLGIESSMPAVPGYKPPINGLCVVPQGMEEGSKVDLPKKEFGLLTGESAQFRFFSSSLRADDQVGLVVDDAESELEEMSQLSIMLPGMEGKRELVPVRLCSVVNELGVLELWMQHAKSDARWKLEFNVRAKS